ncbi:MAG: transcription-repair coupling factor [Melioribacteraceae bacterium]|nr:transcription-repair coupling factor [Melioribacteraceae bacterium]
MENQVIAGFNKLSIVKETQKKLKELKLKEKLYVSVLPGSFKSLFINSIIKEEKQVITLFPDIQSVNEVKVELNLLGLSDKIVAINDLNPETLQERLTELNKRKSYIIIAPYSILNLKLPHKDIIEKNTARIETGGEMGYDEVIEYLNLINYNRDKYVDTQGVYAIRGSIIDFWSFSEKQPCRLEFDGDFLESIRYFDIESQRSSGSIEKVTLASSIRNDSEEYDSNIFDYLTNPVVFASSFELNSLFKKIKPEIEADDIDDELKEEIFEGIEQKEVVEEEEYFKEGSLNSVEELFNQPAKWIIEEEIKSDNHISLNISEAPPINSNYEVLANQLIDFTSKEFTVYITAENEIHSKRLYDLLTELKADIAELLESQRIKLRVLPIKSGFNCKDDKILVLTDYQIFNKPYRTKISSKQKYKKSTSKDFSSIKRGDYVVHENFGIGQYQGLENIKIGMVEQECIKILYADGDNVYVNLNYLSLVKKFSNKDQASPSLSKLGSNEWKNTKKKVKKKIQDAARELIKLYAERKASTGFSFSPDTIWQRELEASFFYEDTPDQVTVTESVKGDMESENPMDRLVCGDVGFGKTEIAVRAAFKAVNDGKQVALLVPTTILAEQHFNTFRDRLTQFPVKVNALSRFRTKAQQTDTLENLKAGKTDVVIGTHRLLSKDVSFKDLGLLIIDEEQRFGVMAKEKLKSIKKNVDTLTLTATPIPRTLNLSLLGARDLSIIATPPPNRQPIYTKVEVFDIVKIKEWVLGEVKRNGQIYFVHDRVQSIDKIAGYIKRHIPNLSIAVAHGQMKPAELEKVIFDFMNKKYQMLIATKIIESGIDIPNVNTIIVNRADRFGLAELHQLRGRVGRSDRKAYAYFIVPSLDTITKKAVKRLQAIEEYSDIGEGFNLSMRDLEIRGSGNLLGTEQSGSIDAVGFDMYVKLLDEAVEELKQKEFSEVFKNLPVAQDRTDPTIDTYFEIGIPEDYMPEQADRLSFYTALFSMVNVKESGEIKEELEDRFGKTPVKVELLIQTAILRHYASMAMFERVVIKKDEVSLILPKRENEVFYATKFTHLLQFIMEKYVKDVRFIQTKDTMKLVKVNKFNNEKAILENLINFCKVIKNKLNEQDVTTS